jgi:hypothetical protein
MSESSRMVLSRTSNVAIFLVLINLPISGCSKSPGTLKDVGFICEHEPNPARVGLNIFTITLTSHSVVPVTGARVSFEGDMSHAGMSPVFADTKEVAPGRYQGSLNLNMRGDWTILFHIDLPGGRSFARELNIRNIQAP